MSVSEKAAVERPHNIKQKPNEQCLCGSALKFKKCCWLLQHLVKDQTNDLNDDGNPEEKTKQILSQLGVDTANHKRQEEQVNY